MKNVKVCLIVSFFVSIIFMSCGSSPSFNPNPFNNQIAVRVQKIEDANLIIDRLDNYGNFEDYRGVVEISLDNSKLDLIQVKGRSMYRINAIGRHRITAKFLDRMAYINEYSQYADSTMSYSLNIDIGNNISYYTVEHLWVDNTRSFYGEFKFVKSEFKLLNKEKYDNALLKAFQEVVNNLNDGARIAIVNIDTTDEYLENYFIDKLTQLFVNTKKFDVVERRNLETIRREHSFQLSGEVDDNAIVGVGHFLGAEYVVTGEIINQGNQSNLRLRVLDVRTARLIGISVQDL